MKLIQHIRRIRLSSRLIAVFLILSLLPGLALAFFSTRVYEKSIEKKTSESVQQSLQLLNRNASIILSDYSRYIDSLSISEELQEYLWALHTNDAADAAPPPDDARFTSVVVPELRHVFLLDTKGNVIINQGYTSISLSVLPDIIHATDEVSPKDYVVHCKTANQRDCLAMCRKIYDDHYTKTPIGYIVLFINGSVLDSDSFPVSSLGEGSGMFMLNAMGLPVAFQNTDIVQDEDRLHEYFALTEEDDSRSIDTRIVSTDDDLILYTYNEEYALYFFSITPNFFLRQEINSVKSIVLGITVFLLFLCLILSLVIYLSVLIPVKTTVSVCEKASTNRPAPLIRDTGNDEITWISNSIDEMNANNERMIQELEERDKQKRDLELEMLRYQINPHFLFNTLNTFKWISEINGLTNLTNGISSLAELLRNSLVQKEELIPLRSEISNVTSYSTIYQMRYAGQFDVSYSIEPESMDCYLPRFILQPLVENAIIHGRRGIDDLLHIMVSSHIEDGRLMIGIQDDGVGFDVHAVYDETKHSYTGIGLGNVDKRLRLYYGEEYRLSVSSEPGHGTLCTIMIPIQLQESEQN